MGLLHDKEWQVTYSREDGNLLKRFYEPALMSAKRYDRTTGYFDAKALREAARGVEELVRNQGRMRLIVGATLSEAVGKAIEHGLEAREAVGSDLLSSGVLDALGSDDREALELLAWMVANHHLDVKIGIPCHHGTRQPKVGTPVFHSKTGIIEDKVGNVLVFSGSLNETRQGWLENTEDISVFCSWMGGTPWIKDHQDRFERLWLDKADGTIVCDLPEAVAQKLLQYLPPEDGLPARLQSPSEVSVANAPPKPAEEAAVAEPPVPEPTNAAPAITSMAPIIEQIRFAANLPKTGMWVGEATSPTVAWPHQRRAFMRMYGTSRADLPAPDHAPKLLIADEVGLGKTIQAGLLIRQMLLAGKLHRCRVLAPASVVNQWQAELREKFALDWPVYDGKCLRQYDVVARQMVERPVTVEQWKQEPFALVSSHLMRRKERQDELLNCEPFDLIIVDEAHHARVNRSGNRKAANRLMGLLRQLRYRTKGLVLLSATPLQTSEMDLYDLLSVLGLPQAWDEESFQHYFEDLSAGPLTKERMERCVGLFQATEVTYGSIPDEWAAILGSAEGRKKPLGLVERRKVLEALRSPSELKRRALEPKHRAAAQRIMHAWTPISRLVSRHSRRLLRQYKADGVLDVQIAERQVADRFITMSDMERDLYERLDKLIADAWKATAGSKAKNAIGFILTVYRKRLASSFAAFASSLERRRDKIADQAAEAGQTDDELLVDDDADNHDDVTSAVEQQADMLLSIDQIDDMLAEVRQLPVDSKIETLVDEIEKLRAAGYSQVMVFTGYTDTMDHLRDLLAARVNRSIACFSGRGGEIRQSNGQWAPVSKAEIKRRFRDKKADILLCTDAAAEGLNFQFCGALINYDMPWNPMRVEQRIGRIDRLGQQFEKIHIVNLHYADTVEAEVYKSLTERIGMFENYVGKLQPILSRASERIATLIFDGVAAADVIARLPDDDADEQLAFDIEDVASSLEVMPNHINPAIDREWLRKLICDHHLPSVWQIQPLDTDQWSVWHDGLDNQVRVTLDEAIYDLNSDSVDFFTVGSKIWC